jgi:NitT/TauT family transport system substrate-binding protein
MRYLKVAAALAVGTACAAPGAATAQDFTVGMPTTPPNIVHMATILANDLGFYKKYGIDVKFVALDGGVKVYRAMIAGSLDIALAPGAFTITGVAKGAAARIVYVNTPKNEASMVANANVKDMADLKGKRIGIQQPGGFADINSRAVLRAAKIDPKDVSFVSIATEDVPALVANQIDTGILHVEQEMLAKSKAPGIHAIARMWELQPKTLYLATVVSDKTIKEKADKLKAYIKANIEATRVMYTDKAKVLPLLVKHTGYPAKTVEDAFDFMVKSCIWDANTGIGAERVDFTAELMTKVGNIEKGKTPKYDAVVHAAIAKDALKEVGEWKGPVCPSAPF